MDPTGYPVVASVRPLVSAAREDIFAMTPPTLASLFAELPALTHEAEARAPEAEALCRLPDDFAERLLRSGAVRVLIPQDLGGIGGSFVDWWRLSLALSTADASTGWVIGQCAMYSAVVAAKHPAPRVRAIFEDPLANVTGSGNGAGMASHVPGGYRFSGRWRFASGCTLASYLTGYPTLEGADDPLGVAMLVPRSEVAIHATWDSVGLRASGSHDIEFRDAFVPDDMIHHPFDGKAQVHGPLAALVQGHWWDSCVAAAVQLGIARHTLTEVWNVARVKPLSPIPGSPLRSTDSAVLRVLQWSEGILFAQQVALEKSLEMLWTAASEGPLDVRERSRPPQLR